MPRRLPVLAFARLSLFVGALAGLGACSTLKRLSEVGDAPQMSSIDNPTLARDYKPVSMPMPSPRVVHPNPNSLWRPGARAFFEDQRAKNVGDILTVVVNFNDTAQFNNSLTRSRGSTNGAQATNALGFEQYLNDFLPGSVDKTNLFNFGATDSTKNSGNINRRETVNMNIASVVIQVLPNRNLVVAGKQEVRVNGEVRELGVTGVIRPEDIRSDNTISWNQIAEARVAYGGRGTLSDMVEPRYGQRIYDVLFPF